MEEQNTELIKMTFDCPRPLRLALRLAAAQEDISMGEYIRQTLEKAVKQGTKQAQPAQEA